MHACNTEAHVLVKALTSLESGRHLWLTSPFPIVVVFRLTSCNKTLGWFSKKLNMTEWNGHIASYQGKDWVFQPNGYLWLWEWLAHFPLLSFLMETILNSLNHLIFLVSSEEPFRAFWNRDHNPQRHYGGSIDTPLNHVLFADDNLLFFKSSVQSP